MKKINIKLGYIDSSAEQEQNIASSVSNLDENRKEKDPSGPAEESKEPNRKEKDPSGPAEESQEPLGVESKFEQIKRQREPLPSTWGLSRLDTLLHELGLGADVLKRVLIELPPNTFTTQDLYGHMYIELTWIDLYIINMWPKKEEKLDLISTDSVRKFAPHFNQREIEHLLA